LTIGEDYDQSPVLFFIVKNYFSLRMIYLIDDTTLEETIGNTKYDEQLVVRDGGDADDVLVGTQNWAMELGR
jgi:hypothetical protein